jgi:hypothetical protein
VKEWKLTESVQVHRLAFIPQGYCRTILLCPKDCLAATSENSGDSRGSLGT